MWFIRRMSDDLSMQFLADASRLLEMAARCPRKDFAKTMRQLAADLIAAAHEEATVAIRHNATSNAA
jgi:hypothetical protein